VSLLARVALLAYPRSFRREYGNEWSRTIVDMATHGQHGAMRVSGTVIAEAFTTAIRMRWENLMKPTKTLLTVVAATIALAALVMGSEAIAVLAVAVVALAALQFAGKDRPIAPTDPAISRRWYLWIAGAAGAFLIGLGVLALDGDDLTSAGWAVWMLSWAGAAVLGVIGIGLGTVRAVNSRG